jgi:hypothetical protein
LQDSVNQLVNHLIIVRSIVTCNAQNLGKLVQSK